jgi:hypothetical protein
LCQWHGLGIALTVAGVKSGQKNVTEPTFVASEKKTQRKKKGKRRGTLNPLLSRCMRRGAHDNGILLNVSHSFFFHTWGRHRQPKRQRRQEELVCPSREEIEELKEGWDGKVKLHDIKVVVHTDPAPERQREGRGEREDKGIPLRRAHHG